MAKLDFDTLNATIRYVMFSAFAVEPGELGHKKKRRAAIAEETADFLKEHEDNGVVVRGIYDVAGMRADADFMIWTHAERLESLQGLYSDFRRTTTLGRACDPVWSSVALHRRPRHQTVLDDRVESAVMAVIGNPAARGQPAEEVESPGWLHPAVAAHAVLVEDRLDLAQETDWPRAPGRRRGNDGLLQGGQRE